MEEQKFDLISALEAEGLLGKKLFYRQRIYRLEKSGRIKGFTFKGQSCYLGYQVIKAVLEDLKLKVLKRYPSLSEEDIEIIFDDKRKVIIVDGIFGNAVTADTELDSEEEILERVGQLIEREARKLAIAELETEQVSDEPHPLHDDMLKSVLPEDVMWMRIDAKELDGVAVRSMILVSLSTVAQYVGVESYNLSNWISNSVYSGYVLSIHPRQIHAPGNQGAWRRGVTAGYSPFLPFELLPEVLVAFRSSRAVVKYPAKAEMLYDLASSTLQVVGLAVSGNKDEAAKALAEVGEGLGLDVADQIIGVMKQYASRDYQVQTQKEFSSTVKQLGQSYAVITGSLTLGITDKSAQQWVKEGLDKGLKKSQATSAREVMRAIAPADGVGMTFGERHYIKEPNGAEAIKTGKESKKFYERLKKVGLLDD